jgi:ArsR family transcriptional regulator
MNEMLDYVKAMSDPNRLRIIGLLSQKSATRVEVARQLKLSPKDSLTHLGFLEFIGVITQTDGVFTLNDDKLAMLAKEKLAEARPAYVPAEHWDEKSKKVLKAHLNADGSIKQIPAQPKLEVILHYLVDFFEYDKNYTEKEVNIILRRFNEDTAGLRRDLVDARLLARESDGSRYWRVKTGGS